MSDNMCWGCGSIMLVVFVSILLFLAIKTTDGPNSTRGSRGSISHVCNGHVRILRDSNGNVKQTARWSNDLGGGHYEDAGLLHRARHTGMLSTDRGYTAFKDMTPREQDQKIESLSRK